MDSSLYLVQDIRAHQEPIWVAKFSPCGQFLATGSKDGVLKIWATYAHSKPSKEVSFLNELQEERSFGSSQSGHDHVSEKASSISKFY